MWTEKWWDEGRPPQTSSASASTNTEALTNGSTSTQTPSGRLKLSNGTSDHHRTLSNGNSSDWEIIMSTTSQADGSMLSSNSSSSPETRKGQDFTPPASSTSLKPAAKLTKKCRNSMANGKALTGKRLVASKSSPDMDITSGQSRDGAQRLSDFNGNEHDSAYYTAPALDIDKGQSNGMDRLTVVTDGGKGHTRHSSISSNDWQLSNKTLANNGGFDYLSQPNKRSNDHNGALSDSLNDINETVGPESSSSKSLDSRANEASPDLSPSPARLFPDLSLDLSANKRVASGSTSDRSSWSESSDTPSWDSSLKTPPLYDICDIASSLSNEKTNHRLHSMQSQLSSPSSSSSPEKNNTRRNISAYIETTASSSSSSAQFGNSSKSSWSEEPAILELNTDSPYFHAPTTSTVPSKGFKKTSRKLDVPTEKKFPKSFSGRGPVPIPNGQAGKQRAYSLISDEGVESRSVVLYEYEKPKKLPEASTIKVKCSKLQSVFVFCCSDLFSPPGRARDDEDDDDGGGGGCTTCSLTTC
ncbi:hypothetical protein ElyMa_001750600 [Elysia marginata]|uniref:Uncharacterized protein n=1 Tax=Elysia marginata TaxID=1093978 RepID=A0AAV4EA00_9GAST|nr:hypothetical protein ElyMa_001750600 [Elysia marginata]